MWYFNEIVQHTWTINPTTVNTATVLNWTQQSAHNATPTVDSSGKNLCWSRFIAVTGAGVLHGGRILRRRHGGWTEPSNEVRTTEGISDTLIKTVHRHTISTGIDLIHQRSVEDAVNYPKPMRLSASVAATQAAVLPTGCLVT